MQGRRVPSRFLPETIFDGLDSGYVTRRGTLVDTAVIRLADGARRIRQVVSVVCDVPTLGEWQWVERFGGRGELLKVWVAGEPC